MATINEMTTGWLIDSGASSHMTCKRELLRDEVRAARNSQSGGWPNCRSSGSWRSAPRHAIQS